MGQASPFERFFLSWETKAFLRTKGGPRREPRSNIGQQEILGGRKGAAPQRFEAFFSCFFLFPLPLHRGLFVEASTFEFFEEAFFRELTFQRLERFLDLILVNFDQRFSLH